MESFGNSSSARKVVSVSGNDDLLNLFSGEGKKIREGGRTRAWRETFECLDKIVSDGGDLDDLRSLLEKVRDGVSTTGEGKPGVVKRVNVVGITRKGNKIYSNTNDKEALEEMFESAYQFPTKKLALAAIDARDISGGVQLF